VPSETGLTYSKVYSLLNHAKPTQTIEATRLVLSILTAIAFILKCLNFSVSISGGKTSYLEIGQQILEMIEENMMNIRIMSSGCDILAKAINTFIENGSNPQAKTKTNLWHLFSNFEK
jgi:hypothetical protein